MAQWHGAKDNAFVACYSAENAVNVSVANVSVGALVSTCMLKVNCCAETLYINNTTETYFCDRNALDVRSL